MKYINEKAKHSEETIETIKEAFNSSSTITFKKIEEGKLTMTIKESGTEKILFDFTYDIFDEIPLAVMGAACKSAEEVILNKEVGYRSYLTNFACNYAALLYFTNFPVSEFTFDELQCFFNLTGGNLNWLYSNECDNFYSDLKKSVLEQLEYDKAMSIHKSEITKIVDGFIKLASKPDFNVDEFIQSAGTILSNTIISSNTNE